MTPTEMKSEILFHRFRRRFGDAMQPDTLGVSDCAKLLRAERALRRWHELECGVNAGHVERDEDTDKPFFVNRYGNRSPIRDAEAGALRTVKRVCDEIGLHFYVQGDPRGCALYVAPFALDHSSYTDGFAVCV